MHEMQRYQELITVSELRALLPNAGVRVVDCRFDLMQPDKGRADYNAGHIPGAHYADLDHDLAGPVRPDSGRHPLPDPALFVRTLQRLGISNDSQVVAYDASNGSLAARLWWMLRWLGHPDVAVLDGGINAWIAAGAPVERSTHPSRAGRFSGHPRAGVTVASEEIAAGLASGTPVTLVDARDAERFAGRSEPIDSRAGHIPGALNLPFSVNLTATGRWQSPERIREHWQSLFNGAAPPDWAVMCGSGVTACHLALSAEIAGMTPPRLYAGSWSEWIRDPERPVSP